MGIREGSRGDERGALGIPGVTAGAMFGDDTTTALFICVGDFRDASDDDRVRFSGEWLVRSIWPGTVPLCRRWLSGEPPSRARRDTDRC